ncbi:MAG: GNAT family N-acetyltransferase [Deltaproteobacteria bacterium]|nr:GNAT family N-acetyltransferase [Deltaproteobacteria bacterium]
MSNLAVILVKNFPKQVNLEDGTAITLRPLLKDDEQAFLAYFRSLAPEERVVLREEVTDPKVIENWMETLDYDLVLPLLAFHGKRIIGAASLQFNLSAWTQHQGEVRLSTDPQYRAKGLGTLLIQTLEDIAAKLGLEQLTAEIPPELDKAFYLFEKLGFEKAAVLQGFAMDEAGRESDIVLMIKSLLPAQGKAA